jgi:hypothetical protein
VAKADFVSQGNVVAEVDFVAQGNVVLQSNVVAQGNVVRATFWPTLLPKTKNHQLTKNQTLAGWKAKKRITSSKLTS